MGWAWGPQGALVVAKGLPRPARGWRPLRRGWPGSPPCPGTPRGTGLAGGVGRGVLAGLGGCGSVGGTRRGQVRGGCLFPGVRLAAPAGFKGAGMLKFLCPPPFHCICFAHVRSIPCCLQVHSSIQTSSNRFVTTYLMWPKLWPVCSR